MDLNLRRNGQGMKFGPMLQPWNMKMNLEDIMLSEISQSQKDKYGRIPLI